VHDEEDERVLCVSGSMGLNGRICTVMCDCYWMDSSEEACVYFV
jgi:hypothetical protein